MQVEYLQREGTMVAFLVFFGVMIAFIAGGVCISMYLYVSHRTEYEVVTLGQDTFLGEIEHYKLQRSQLDMGMKECAWRISGIALGIVTVILVVIVAFFNTPH